MCRKTKTQKCISTEERRTVGDNAFIPMDKAKEHIWIYQTNCKLCERPNEHQLSRRSDDKCKQGDGHSAQDSFWSWCKLI